MGSPESPRCDCLSGRKYFHDPTCSLFVPLSLKDIKRAEKEAASAKGLVKA